MKKLKKRKSSKCKNRILFNRAQKIANAIMNAPIKYEVSAQKLEYFEVDYNG